MDLVINEIESGLPGELPVEGAETFAVHLRVVLGERGKEGAEAFYFIAASPTGLHAEIGKKGFTLMRGLILMDRFSLTTVHRAIDNVINHARSLETWNEIVRFFNRYGVYESEDMDGEFDP